MQKKISSRSLIVAGIVALAALQASNTAAQMYISGGGGVSFLTDADTTDTIATGSIGGEVTTDAGFVLNGAVGYAMRNGLRIEGEISYRENDLDSFDIDTVTTGGATFSGTAVAVPLTGDISSLGFMANAYYDFYTGSNWVPFVGGGLGVAIVSVDVNSFGGVSSTFDESDTVFAYQLGAGLGYRVNRHSKIDVSYRLLGTSDPEFSDGVDTLETEYLNHSIMVGYTYTF